MLQNIKNRANHPHWLEKCPALLFTHSMYHISEHVSYTKSRRLQRLPTPYSSPALFTSRLAFVPSRVSVMWAQRPACRFASEKVMLPLACKITSRPWSPSYTPRLSPHASTLAPGIHSCGFIQNCRVTPVAVPSGREPRDTRPFSSNAKAWLVTWAIQRHHNQKQCCKEFLHNNQIYNNILIYSCV